ncbi:MAG: zinc protease [Saprospiraceae bacterium]|jgi:zinc protease|tara:strand:- start:397 stop:1674 length:1278 start_codon:yes stop_codon:yes gene_type:complete
MSVDRKHGPEIKKITELRMPPIRKETLSNGIELIEVNMGTQNLVQLEVLFRGGRLNEAQKGVSRAVARLLKEGTQSYTGSQLAEEVDFYGANISSGASLDYSYIKIFTLNKYFQKLLPILEEVVYKPSFTEEELEKYAKNSIQRLKVEMAKSELVAYKVITEKLYGKDHVYGYNSTDEIYKDLTRQKLLDYYDSTYGTDNCIVIMSGKITEDIRQSVKELFGKQPKKKVALKFDLPSASPKIRSERIKAEDNLQSAIKIGCRLFKRDHEDFQDMFVLNTILGGYFGSRLMSSLREEKGYTYNIYSSIDMMIYDGYFNVSTEVGNQYLEATLEGIYSEMERLKNEKIGDEELDMVKNYLSGNFLNMVDGPFKVAGIAKVGALNNLDIGFYQRLMSRIHSVTADDLQALAQKYLIRENMIEIIVGNP